MDENGVKSFWNRVKDLVATVDGNTIAEWNSYESAVSDMNGTPLNTLKFYLLSKDINGNSVISSAITGTENVGYGILSGDVCKNLLMGEADKGYSVGDILAIVHYANVPLLGAPLLKGMILPTQDAKPRKGNFPGADGIETIYDKEQIMKVMSLFTGNGQVSGNFYAGEVYEPGLYFKMTLGRPAGSEDGEEYLLLVTPGKRYENGWRDILQICFSLKYPGKSFYRWGNFNPSNVFQSYGNWEVLTAPKEYAGKGEIIKAGSVYYKIPSEPNTRYAESSIPELLTKSDKLYAKVLLKNSESAILVEVPDILIFDKSWLSINPVETTEDSGADETTNS